MPRPTTATSNSSSCHPWCRTETSKPKVLETKLEFYSHCIEPMKTIPQTIRPTVALLIVSAFQLLPLLAQDLPFNSTSTGADGALRFREIPVGGRTVHGMAYDPVRQEVVLF